MKTTLSYSIAIRTTGKAGEKYQKLLNSIKSLIPQPEKVVVVLPEGYLIPEERLGSEEFVFSAKGMILQRLAALSYINSEFILFCDDDVAFPSVFVEKLSEPLLSGQYACSSGPLLDFFPPNEIKYWLASILGGACIMLHGRKNNYVRLLNTGGWSYNRSININKHKIYNTDSLAWTCFFIRKTAMDAIHFEQENYLDVKGYAAFDDQTFIRKLQVNGFLTAIVSDAEYTHNDAKSSIDGLRFEPYYAHRRNHCIFWHRFIYSLKGNVFAKLWAIVCVIYFIFMDLSYSLLISLLRARNIAFFINSCQAYKDALRFIQSEEYKSLENPIIRV